METVFREVVCSHCIGGAGTEQVSKRELTFYFSILTPHQPVGFYFIFTRMETPLFFTFLVTVNADNFLRLKR